MAGIAVDIGKINTRLFIAEGKVDAEELIINAHDARLKKLESYASIKWTIIRWGVAVLIAVLIGLLMFAWHENKKLAQDGGIKHSYSNWTPEYQLQIQNAPVRGTYIPEPRKFTQAYKDSADKADIEKTTKELDKMLR